MKKIIPILTAILLLLASAQAQANLTWEAPYKQFNYRVNNNGGGLLLKGTAFNPNANSIVVKTNTNGGVYSDKVNSSHSSYPLAGIFTMKAGAQGTGTMSSPADGLQVQGYTEMNLTGFNPSIHAVDVDQWVFANVTRNFSVTSPGDYLFEADLSGLIDFNIFSGSPNYNSSYSVTGEATINKYIVDTNGNITGFVGGGDTGHFLLGDTNRNASDVISLQSMTADGNDIYYQLILSLTLRTSLDNFEDQFFTPANTTGMPPFTGPFLLGSQANPLILEGSITPYEAPVQTPLPGSFFLLFSGLGGAGAMRRLFRRK